jgi:DNA-binding protein YbaB
MTMKDKFTALEEKLKALEDVEFTGEAGAGLVKVYSKSYMGNPYCINKVVIDPLVLKENDKLLIEDLLAAAVNDCISKINDATVDIFLEESRKVNKNFN